MTRRALAPALLVAAVAALATGCVAEDPVDVAPTPQPTAASSDPATPSPTPTFAVPDTLPGEIARAVFGIDSGPDGIPQTAYTATDAVQADVPFAVTGECVGDSVDFEVVRAAVGDSGTVLVAGTLECGVVPATGAIATPYAGLVQLVLKSTDDVEYAWLAVVPG